MTSTRTWMVYQEAVAMAKEVYEEAVAPSRKAYMEEEE